jgi:hypothetical protein
MKSPSNKQHFSNQWECSKILIYTPKLYIHKNKTNKKTQKSILANMNVNFIFKIIKIRIKQKPRDPTEIPIHTH